MPDPDKTKSPSDAPHDRLGLVLSFVGAVATGAAIAIAIWVAYPKDLDVSTDIVGYPIFADFNARTYFVGYFLIAVVFPAISIATYVFIRRLGGATRGPRAVSAASGGGRTASEGSSEPAPANSLARAAVVGAVWGLTLAVAVGGPDHWLFSVLLPVTLGYVGVVYAVSRLIGRRRAEPPSGVIATVNTVGAAFLGLALLAASQASHVTEIDSGREVDYPFAPAWLLAGLALAAGALIARSALRRRSDEPARLELNVLLYLAGPLALFIMIAALAGTAQGAVSIFEEGQRLTGRTLLVDGWVPWRDMILVHGVLEDGLLPILAMGLIEDSRWGQLAGSGAIITPLFWVGNYLLGVYLFRRNLLFLIGIQLLVILGWVGDLGLQRLILLPIVLLALAALLERPTWPRAWGLILASAAQAVLVPEAAFFSAATWAIVLIRDFAAARGWAPYGEPWVRTIRCLVAGIATAVVLVVALAAAGALDEFVEFYLTYSRDHELTGALRFNWIDLDYKFWVFAPLVVILISWWYAAARIGSGRWFTNPELVVGAAVIGLIPYYTKFLARADGHVFNVATAAFIPLAYIVYRLLAVPEEGLRVRFGALARLRHPLTAALFVAVVVAAPLSTTDILEGAPSRLHGVAAAAPVNDRIGYSADADLPPLAEKMTAAVDRYAGEGGEVFDFTNSPGLFYYLTDGRPAIRHLEVTAATREPTQEDLISELDEARPPLVAYSSQVHGLPSWDGIANPVRNYLVSDYLLDNYRPLAQVDDYVLMAPDEPAAGKPSLGRKRGLYFQGLSCDWGAVPNFLDQEPAMPEDAVEVAATPAGASTLLRGGGWAADIERGVAAARILITDGERVLASAPTGIRRDDVQATFGVAGLETTGFQLKSVIIPGNVAVEELRIFGVNRDGVAAELGTPATAAPRALRRADGSSIPVVSGAVQGSVDDLLATPLERLRLRLPAGFDEYDWLRVSAPAEIGDTRFIVSDGKPGDARTIAFGSIDGAQSELVRVGSCPQWKGYGGRTLFIDVDPPTGPLSAELIR